MPRRYVEQARSSLRSLEELGGERLLHTALVEQPRGNLQQPAADRMPVLTHHRDPAVLIARDDGNGTEMLDDFAFGNPTARHLHLVEAKREYRSVVDHFARLHREDVGAGSGALAQASCSSTSTVTSSSTAAAGGGS